MKLRRLFSLGTVARTQVPEKHNPPLSSRLSSSFLPDQHHPTCTSCSSPFIHFVCRNARHDREATLWATR